MTEETRDESRLYVVSARFSSTTGQSSTNYGDVAVDQK